MTPRIALLLCLELVFLSGAPAQDRTPQSWNSQAAAAYLDGRAEWWMGWATAARDHGTFCVSCHTALPYMLARPALRKTLAETGPSPNESKILDNVTKRVTLWTEVQPLQRRKARRAENPRVPRNRSRAQRIDRGQLRRPGSPSPGEYARTPVDERRLKGSMALAKFSQ